MDTDTGVRIHGILGRLTIGATELFMGLEELTNEIKHDSPEALAKIEMTQTKQGEFSKSLEELCEYLYPVIRKKCQKFL